MPSYGLIVEGLYDAPVLRCLTVRFDSPDPKIFVRECRGIRQLRTKLIGYLRTLEFVDEGRPVEKAIVFADCDGRNQSSLEDELRGIVSRVRFSFPNGIAICGVKRELESWLLADEEAISAVAVNRGGRPVGYIPGAIEEDILDPKQKLRKVLAEAHLPYTPPVLGEIAERMNLETAKYRLPSLISFAEKV